jgi:NAD(P)H-nitrite reductase large subunit
MAMIGYGNVSNRQNRTCRPRPLLIGKFAYLSVRSGNLVEYPSHGVPDSSAIVCASFRVGESDIRKAIAADTASVEGLSELLKVGTDFGSCTPELRKLLAMACA